jgi:hypothetical protein
MKVIGLVKSNKRSAKRESRYRGGLQTEKHAYRLLRAAGQRVQRAVVHDETAAEPTNVVQLGANKKSEL